MRIDAGLYQKTPVIDLLNLVKNPAVATAAFWVPFPTVTPASAATPHGVGLGPAGRPPGNPESSGAAGETWTRAGIPSPDRSAPGSLSRTGRTAGTVASSRAVSESASDGGSDDLLDIADEADDVGVLA
jgi:hypothetical protein